MLVIAQTPPVAPVAPAAVTPTDAPTVDAQAYTVEPVPDGLRFVSQVNGLPQELSHLAVGPVKDFLRHGNTFYVALNAGGVLVIDAQLPRSPVVTAHLVEGQLVAQLAHQGEEVLVVLLQSRDSAPFSLTDPLHPVPAQLVATVASPYAGKGRVLAVRDGALVIDGGSATGLHQGEHVKILSHTELSAQDELAQQQGLSILGTVTAVVVLDRVEPHRAIAHLGRGDSAQAGDSVIGTGDATTDSLATPHAVPFEWQLNFALRPFLDTNNSDSHAVGLLTDVMVAYYFHDIPLKIEGGIAPLGLVAGGNQQHNPTVALLDLAFSSPFFEIGLGSGFSVLATGDCGPLGGTCSQNAVDPLITQTLRLGALDGLNLLWTSAIASTGNDGFVFRSGRAVANLPVSTRVTLFLDGGGGTGYSFGDIGARTYLNGLGGPGTFILSGGLGFAEVNDSASSNGIEDPETLVGPSVMLGLEMRL